MKPKQKIYQAGYRIVQVAVQVPAQYRDAVHEFARNLREQHGAVLSNHAQPETKP